MSGDKDNLTSMMCLDIYLSSLTGEEYRNLAPKIKPVKTLPLLSWDIAINNGITSEPVDAVKLKLNQLALRHFWKLDIDSVLNTKYEAVVVTTADLDICWVSDGFTAMTGYTFSYAVGRKPNFLQGKNTSDKTRSEIRECLRVNEPYNGTIVNYRKNKEEYVCDVKIIPITNYNDEVTHYIALEREAV